MIYRLALKARSIEIASITMETEPNAAPAYALTRNAIAPANPSAPKPSTIEPPINTSRSIRTLELKAVSIDRL